MTEAPAAIIALIVIVFAVACIAFLGLDWWHQNHTRRRVRRQFGDPL